MAKPQAMVELPVTLTVSNDAKERLTARAAESGTDVGGYISALLEQCVQKPLTLEEISGSIYQRFLESGMSDEELSELLEREKHEARAANRARRAS